MSSRLLLDQLTFGIAIVLSKTALFVGGLGFHPVIQMAVLQGASTAHISAPVIELIPADNQSLDLVQWSQEAFPMRLALLPAITSLIFLFSGCEVEKLPLEPRVTVSRHTPMIAPLIDPASSPDSRGSVLEHLD